MYLVIETNEQYSVAEYYDICDLEKQKNYILFISIPFFKQIINIRKWLKLLHPKKRVGEEKLYADILIRAQVRTLSGIYKFGPKMFHEECYLFSMCNTRI